MKKHSMGFTLVELMIVIAIIGILAAVGYPAYINSTNKANRGDAISGLVALSKRMEEYYNDNDTYVGATVNVTGTGTVGSSKTTDDLYTLSITTATLFAYSLTATPKTANSECSTLTYDSLGVKGSTGTEATCW